MPTREIILLRHAHAEPAQPEQTDRDRPLGDIGRDEAAAAADWLKRHNAQPTLALHSPALRTRETCERVLAVLGGATPTADERIYEATPADLIRVLDEHADARRVLLVGHNPGLESLVALLTEGASDAGRGLPPAGIAWLALPSGVIEPGTAEVRHFWWP